FPGVTLSVAGSDNTPSTFFRVRAATDSLASTGTKVFSEEGIPFWTNAFRFRADFAQPVAAVSLDYISAGFFGSEVAYLRAYDASGTLLASYDSPSVPAGQVQTLTIARGTADIAYVVAYTSAFGRFDNLHFGVDEPAAVTDADGNYAFTGLQPGSYVVREVVPDGY